MSEFSSCPFCQMPPEIEGDRIRCKYHTAWMHLTRWNARPLSSGVAKKPKYPKESCICVEKQEDCPCNYATFGVGGGSEEEMSLLKCLVEEMDVVPHEDEYCGTNDCHRCNWDVYAKKYLALNKGLFWMKDILDNSCEHEWGNFSLHCKTCQKCGIVEAIQKSSPSPLVPFDEEEVAKTLQKLVNSGIKWEDLTRQAKWKYFVQAKAICSKYGTTPAVTEGNLINIIMNTHCKSRENGRTNNYLHLNVAGDIAKAILKALEGNK